MGPHPGILDWYTVIGGLVAVVALAGVAYFSRAAQYRKAFVSSCVYLTFMLVGAAVALYPTLLPSSSDPALDITMTKAMAGPYALSVGLIWWSLGIALAIGYFVFVYRMFRGKVRLAAEHEH